MGFFLPLLYVVFGHWYLITDIVYPTLAKKARSPMQQRKKRANALFCMEKAEIISSTTPARGGGCAYVGTFFTT
jgi:hypothetical protein